MISLLRLIATSNGVLRPNELRGNVFINSDLSRGGPNRFTDGRIETDCLNTLIGLIEGHDEYYLFHNEGMRS